MQAEGRRLALLTTLVQVLDHKCEELLAGTGPLENDIKILEVGLLLCRTNMFSLDQTHSSFQESRCKGVLDVDEVEKDLIVDNHQLVAEWQA